MYRRNMKQDVILVKTVFFEHVYQNWRQEVACASAAKSGLNEWI